MALWAIRDVWVAIVRVIYGPMGNECRVGSNREGYIWPSGQLGMCG